MATVRMQRFIWTAVLAAGMLIVLVWVGVASAHPAGKRFTSCGGVLVAAVPQLPGREAAPLADTGCILGKCLERKKRDDGTSICHYGRSATLTRNCVASASTASRVVAETIKKGWNRTTIGGAGLASIHTVHSPLSASSGAAVGVLVTFSVGKAVVQMQVGAISDDDPNPTWSAARQIAISGARKIAGAWAKRPVAAQC